MHSITVHLPEKKVRPPLHICVLTGVGAGSSGCAAARSHAKLLAASAARRRGRQHWLPYHQCFGTRVCAAGAGACLVCAGVWCAMCALVRALVCCGVVCCAVLCCAVM